MAKYRVIVPPVEALRFTGPLSIDDMLDEWGEGFRRVATYIPQTNELELEGRGIATTGDWVIRDLAGAFFSCPPNLFKAAYEPVEDGN